MAMIDSRGSLERPLTSQNSPPACDPQLFRRGARRSCFAMPRHWPRRIPGALAQRTHPTSRSNLLLRTAACFTASHAVRASLPRSIEMNLSKKGKRNLQGRKKHSAPGLISHISASRKAQRFGPVFARSFRRLDDSSLCQDISVSDNHMVDLGRSPAPACNAS